jgi:hypothetical protein
MTTYCRLGEGKETVAIEPEAVIGGFALHRRIVGRRALGPQWTVTHRGTGRSVWTVEQFTDAIRVAEWLVEKQYIPEDGDVCNAWADSLPDSDRTFLIEQLQLLAPRWQP